MDHTFFFVFWWGRYTDQLSIPKDFPHKKTARSWGGGVNFGIWTSALTQDNLTQMAVSVGEGNFTNILEGLMRASSMCGSSPQSYKIRSFHRAILKKFDFIGKGPPQKDRHHTSA
jgi:hypothetical protein